MKRWWRFRRSFGSGEAGIILPLILVFLALGLLLLTPTLGHGYTSLQGNQQTNDRAEELHAADSGVEEGIYWLINARPGTNYQWDEGEGEFVRNAYSLNGVDVHVTIEPLTGQEHINRYKITSVAQRPGGLSSTVLSEVYAVPVLEGPQVIHDDYVGDLVIDGSLEIGTGHTTVTGDVIVFGEPGTLDMGQGSAIVGDVYSEGDVTMGQSSNIHCEVLCTEGNIDMGQSTEIDPPAVELTTEVHFLGPGSGSVDYGTDVGHYLIFENTAELYGDIFSEGDLTIEVNKKHTNVHGNIIVDGNLTIIMDGSEAQGAVYGHLYATGNVTIELDPKKATAGIFGDLYYDDDSTYTPGPFNGATYPDVVVCADFESDCSLPEPEKTCPGVPDPAARVISWEIS